MAQEEIYIKLIQGEKVAPEEIPKEFLRDFQFCKIALEKNRIDLFSEEQQREMNLQAVEIHLHSSKWICLKCDIPEIVRLVPENVSGNLDLYNSQIKELPQLKSVGRDLYLRNSQIRELPQLKSVGGGLFLDSSQIGELSQLESVGKGLDLWSSPIRELPQLKSVGESLDLGDSKIRELLKLERVGWGLFLRNSQIKELPQLESVGYRILVNREDLQHWKDYFAQTNRAHLAAKVFAV
jgi:hypothetical protein